MNIMSVASRFLLNFEWKKEDEDLAQEFINALASSEIGWVLPPHRAFDKSIGVGVVETTRSKLDTMLDDIRGCKVEVVPIIQNEDYVMVSLKAREWNEEDNHIRFLTENGQSFF